MTNETVEYQSSGRYAIPYRATPRERDADGNRVWDMEYMQEPKSGYWGPRGRFDEIDGKFHIGGKIYDSAYLALRHKAEFL